MTRKKLPRPFQKRSRRRAASGSDDPAAVFKTFVHVLAQMQARGATAMEKG